MSRNKLFILIFSIFALLFLLLGGVYWYLSSNNSGASPTDVLKQLVGFGSSGIGAIGNSGQDFLANLGIGTSTNQDNLPVVIPRLRILYSQPTSGSFVFAKGTSTMVRFVDTANGFIYEINETSSTPIEISTTTIPLVDASMWANPNQLIMRFLNSAGDTYQHFNATLVTYNAKRVPSQILPIDGTFLADSVREASFSPAGDKLFYFSLENSAYTAIVANTAAGNRVAVSTLPTTEWLAEWTTPAFITLTPKPSRLSSGYLYGLNPQSGVLRKLAGPLFGLTGRVSPDGNYLLYADDRSGLLYLNAKNLKTAQIQGIGIKTLPEKCAWSAKEKAVVYCGVPQDIPFEAYPDAWYEGSISFTDDIWRINVETGDTRLVLKLSDLAQTQIDLIEPHIGINDDYIVFTNKTDSSLWSYKLSEEE